MSDPELLGFKIAIKRSDYFYGSFIMMLTMKKESVRREDVSLPVIDIDMIHEPETEKSAAAPLHRKLHRSNGIALCSVCCRDHTEGEERSEAVLPTNHRHQMPLGGAHHPDGGLLGRGPRGEARLRPRQDICGQAQQVSVCLKERFLKESDYRNSFREFLRKGTKISVKVNCYCFCNLSKKKGSILNSKLKRLAAHS